MLTPNIQSVNLSRNKALTGNLSMVSHCHSLYDICLEGTQVKLAVIQPGLLRAGPGKKGCQPHMTFFFCLAQVTGDLSALASCTKLHKVYLSDLKVTGDIATFKRCLALKKIWLRDTDVYGDIGEAFRDTTLLVDVMLRRTQVAGAQLGAKASARGCLFLEGLALLVLVLSLVPLSSAWLLGHSHGTCTALPLQLHTASPCIAATVRHRCMATSWCSTTASACTT